MMSYKDYKQHVAPLYKTEHERRLFATASGDKSKSLKDELARLIKGRFRKRSKPEDSEDEKELNQ